MPEIRCTNPECGVKVEFPAESGPPESCPLCGVPIDAGKALRQAEEQGGKAADSGGGKKKKVLLAGAAAAVLLLVAVMVVVIRGTSRPQATTEPSPEAALPSIPAAAGTPTPSPTPTPFAEVSAEPPSSPVPTPTPAPETKSPPPSVLPSPSPVPSPKGVPPEVRELLESARRHAEAGEYNLAVDDLKKALAKIEEKSFKKRVAALMDEYTALGLRASDIADARRFAAEGNYVRAVCLYERAASRTGGKLPPEAAEGMARAARLITGASFSPRSDIVMVGFPSVKFEMGNRKGWEDEKPVHAVRLSPYWMMDTEVTNALFLLAVKDKVLRPPTFAHFGKSVWTKDGPPANALNHPVTAVSWAAAMRFCMWLTRKHHEEYLLPKFMAYTLPTEAQWEYAAGGGDKRILPEGFGFYSRYAVLGKYSLYGVESVKMRISNRFGLYDMAGNAAEWCFDRYGPYLKADEKDPRGPSEGSERVVRGGSFLSQPYNCTASVRFHLPPQTKASYVGFRLAAVISDRKSYLALVGSDGERGGKGGKKCGRASFPLYSRPPLSR